MRSRLVAMAWIPVSLCLVQCEDGSQQKSASATKTTDGEVIASSLDGVLARVGSFSVTQSDVVRQQDTRSRRSGLELVEGLENRARLAQAALDLGLDQDPSFKDQLMRMLASKYRAEVIDQEIARELAAIPEERIRRLYEESGDRFRGSEKRKVAVLWLNAGNDGDRVRRYQQKLEKARRWFHQNQKGLGGLQDGFAMLSVDHSEHAASRYRGGVLGWIDAESSRDPWTCAVAEIAFSLGKPGDVSEVVTGPEGVFLVRLLEVTASRSREYESVRDLLKREEEQRVRVAVIRAHQDELESRYPVERSETHPAVRKPGAASTAPSSTSSSASQGMRHEGS